MGFHGRPLPVRECDTGVPSSTPPLGPESHRTIGAMWSGGSTSQDLQRIAKMAHAVEASALDWIRISYT